MMLKVPPTMREWKKDSVQSTSMITPTESHITLHKSVCSQPKDNDEIIVLKFQNVTTNNEISVSIESPLTMTSTLAAVMDIGGVNDEFGLLNYNLDKDLTTPVSMDQDDKNNKFRILKQNELYYTFRCDKLVIMTVSSLVRMKNVHDNYLIEL